MIGKTQVYPGWDQEKKKSTCAYSCYLLKWGGEEQEGDLGSAELVEYGEEIRIWWFEDPNKVHMEGSKDITSD